MQEQFPGDASALRAIQRIVTRYRKEYASDPSSGLELEVRCGRDVDGAFKPGVSVDFLDRAVSLVQANPALELDDWREIEDTFFDLGGVEYRSRSMYDTDEIDVRAVTIVKTRICECILRNGGFAMRLVLSREREVHNPKGVVTPKHVRIHQRRRAQFTSNDFGPRRTWMLEFGMVWSGCNKTEAETLQMNNAIPQYTLELELLDPLYVVRRGDEFVACSIGLKMAGFFEERAHFTC